MIRTRYFQNNAAPQSDIEPAGFAAAISEPGSLLWVDFVGEPPETCEPILLQTFGFHPLAVDDALRESHVPKVDDWDDYLYIVLHDIGFQPVQAGIDTFELDVFLGRNYIVTHHDSPISALDRVWELSVRDERSFKRGADHILYRITDELAADFMQVIEDMDDEIDKLEGEVFKKQNSSMVQRIFALKRATLHLRRVMSPLREVFNKLARDDYAVIDKRDRVYFRDVYDHLVRLHDISESLRDLVGGTLDTYLSVVNNRMNDTMKTLTLITTLFMPISFLAGFFGMNFFAPEVTSPLNRWVDVPTFIPMLVLFTITPLIMYLWMRRRGWTRRSDDT
jgi:magnesium transporter